MPRLRSSAQDLPVSAGADACTLEFPVSFGYLNTVVCLNSDFRAHGISSSALHSHHDFELYYAVNGHCTVTVHETSVTVAAGDVCILHPQEYHCKVRLSPANAQLFQFRFSVRPPQEKEGNAFKKDAYDFFTDFLQSTRLLHARETSVLSLLQRIQEEFLQRKAGYLGCIQSLFSLLFTELVRLAEPLPEHFFPAEEQRFRGYDRTVLDSFFAKKYLSNVKIQDLAYDMKVSVRQVNRVMHRMFGMSFTQKLTEMRLWEVARQLKSTQKPITTISQNCGFNNYNYFYICFRKKFGMTPTEYRACHAEASISPQKG